ncbi:hypothetical protein L1987_54591 [Smallanthus sonchifolius]|uniref:Uncharacterized protein n=1 Tax=Smallanthus sonchifolius TaxID=185202 RepID=A0ACB9E7E2_9ASTR|nr:hypothetical protein L1987_54591 [Smallanthus sonchifolius]
MKAVVKENENQRSEEAVEESGLQRGREGKVWMRKSATSQTMRMQRSKVKPDVVSYAQLISSYGKVLREEEALALSEEMLIAFIV